MLSKPAAFGLLAVACIAAAAGGAYVATRQLVAPGQSTATGAGSVSAPASANATAGTAGEASRTVGPNSWPLVSAEQAKPAAERAHPANQAVSAASAARRPGSARKGRQAIAGDAVDRQIAAPADEERRDQLADGPQQPPLGGTPPTSVVPPTGVPPTLPLPPPVESAPPLEANLSQQPLETVFEDLVVPGDSVLGLQLETPLASERAQVEDRVTGRVTRDVRVGDRVVIPAGTEVEGSVVQVGRGGKVKERAYLAIRFHTLVMADSTRIQITTDPIYREGASNSSASAAKIGGAAVGGAILGAIIGGSRGAAIGGSIGAAGGTAAVMAGDRSAVVLSAGTLLTIRLLSPLTLTIER